MHPLVARVRAKLQREPLGEVMRKGLASALAMTFARTYLRGSTSAGRRVRCFGKPRISNLGSLHVGDDFTLSCTFGTASLVTTPTGAIRIGRSVTINYGTSIRATRRISIGDRVLVGPYCVIEDTDVPGDEREAAPIAIGDDVWLAARVVVRPGAHIGAGAVIAAGSVVEGEIPPNAVASGVPARVLRIREPHEIVEAHHAAVA